MKTVRNVKSMLGIQSVRKDNKWFWVMPEKNSGEKLKIVSFKGHRLFTSNI